MEVTATTLSARMGAEVEPRLSQKRKFVKYSVFRCTDECYRMTTTETVHDTVYSTVTQTMTDLQTTTDIEIQTYTEVVPTTRIWTSTEVIDNVSLLETTAV